MGMYLNPGNDGFQDISRRGYVDKTGMIALINDTSYVFMRHMFSCATRFHACLAANGVLIK